MTDKGVDWNTIILALIAIIPGIVAAYFARGAKAKAESAVATMEVVKKQTDGLATAMKTAGFAEGVKQEKDAAVVAVALDAKQSALIEAIVQRLLAAQTAVLVTAPTTADPGPQTAGQLTAIKSVVDDVQPRVVAIEGATADRDKAL